MLLKVLPAPDYVLLQSMEKGKKREEREVTVEREPSPEEDSMTRCNTYLQHIFQ